MTTRTIALLGTGAVAIALAKGFARRGDQVLFGTRAPVGPAARSALDAVPDATAMPHLDAARRADMAVIALPWDALPSILTPALDRALAGKVLIDATNPLAFVDGRPTLAIGHNDSSGETVQRLLPSARVVKAFNIITASRMVEPRFADGRADMFIAGDDPDAKADVTALLRDFGWRGAIDCGGIERSRLLEPLAMLWIAYGFAHGHWGHGFSLLGQAP